MYSALTIAKRSIYLEMYAFQDDTIGYDFLSLLREKALSGVRVILILDSFGSSGLASDEVGRLRSSGAEVLFFSYWLRRLHRKILVIDETVAFLGGVNISGEYAPWRDLQVRVIGKRFVSSAIRSFARVYKECKGKDKLILEKGKDLPFRKARTWFLEHGIGGRIYALRKHYEKNISEAKTSILLFTPYLVPRRWLMAHLHEAILRGVRVEIVVPEHTDHAWLMGPVNRYHFALFTRMGAVCFFVPEMNHSKVMLVDGKKATIGSQNLDPLSFDMNAEAGIVFEGKGMIRDLQKILYAWREKARVFDPALFKPKWYHGLFSLFRRWL